MPPPRERASQRESKEAPAEFRPEFRPEFRQSSGQRGAGRRPEREPREPPLTAPSKREPLTFATSPLLPLSARAPWRSTPPAQSVGWVAGEGEGESWASARLRAGVRPRSKQSGTARARGARTQCGPCVCACVWAPQCGAAASYLAFISRYSLRVEPIGCALPSLIMAVRSFISAARSAESAAVRRICPSAAHAAVSDEQACAVPGLSRLMALAACGS